MKRRLSATRFSFSSPWRENRFRAAEAAGIMQTLVKFRRHHVKSFAILLLIVATLSLQAAPLTPIILTTTSRMAASSAISLTWPGRTRLKR